MWEIPGVGWLRWIDDSYVPGSQGHHPSDHLMQASFCSVVARQDGACNLNLVLHLSPYQVADVSRAIREHVCYATCLRGGDDSGIITMQTVTIGACEFEQCPERMLELEPGMRKALYHLVKDLDIRDFVAYAWCQGCSEVEISIEGYPEAVDDRDAVLRKIADAISARLTDHAGCHN